MNSILQRPLVLFLRRMARHGLYVLNRNWAQVSDDLNQVAHAALCVLHGAQLVGEASLYLERGIQSSYIARDGLTIDVRALMLDCRSHDPELRITIAGGGLTGEHMRGMLTQEGGLGSIVRLNDRHATSPQCCDIVGW